MAAASQLETINEARKPTNRPTKITFYYSTHAMENNFQFLCPFSWPPQLVLSPEQRRQTYKEVAPRTLSTGEHRQYLGDLPVIQCSILWGYPEIRNFFSFKRIII